MTSTGERRDTPCPAWCVRADPLSTAHAHQVHSSASLRVGPTLMRLCAAAETGTAGSGPPFILVGRQRYTLHEAEVLIDALTQLVDSGLGLNPPEGA